MVRKNIQKEEVPREEERGFVEGIELVTQRQDWSFQQYLASRDLSASQPNISDLSTLCLPGSEWRGGAVKECRCQCFCLLVVGPAPWQTTRSDQGVSWQAYAPVLRSSDIGPEPLPSGALDSDSLLSAAQFGVMWGQTPSIVAGSSAGWTACSSCCSPDFKPCLCRQRAKFDVHC